MEPVVSEGKALNEEELKMGTLARIEQALEETELVSSTKVIRLIREISTKASDISIEELTELVNRDVTVTRKVMVSANKIGVNPLGATVQTVSQAVHMIGFNKVRNLAVSLLLMKNSSEMANNPLQKEVSSKALCSGIVAQEIMQSQSEDLGERAFICATLRNYGNLLLSTFLPYEYEQAIDYMDVLNEHKAYRKVFGLLPVEISQYFLKKEKMPEEILKTIAYVPLDIVSVENRRQEERLMVAADFASKFCDYMSNSALSADNFAQKANRLLEQYGKNIHLGRDGVDGLLSNVVGSLEAFSELYGFNLFHDKYFKKLTARNEGIEPEKEVFPRTERTPKTLPPFNDELKAPKRDYLKKGLERLSQMIDEQPQQIGPLYEVAMQALLRGLEMDSIALFGVHYRDQTLRVMAGCGEFYQFAKTVECIPSHEKDLFGLCVMKGMDAIFQNAQTHETQKWMPPWMIEFPKVSALVMLPIRLQGKTVGFICLVNTEGRVLELQTERLEMVRKVATKLNEGVRLASG